MSIDFFVCRACDFITNDCEAGSCKVCDESLCTDCTPLRESPCVICSLDVVPHDILLDYIVENTFSLELWTTMYVVEQMDKKGMNSEKIRKELDRMKKEEAGGIG